ncbi:helix-turn-helix transcriptional regulator [Microbacterium lacticum]|uniref:helix-turn-helix domain-containing protein n=1 Tax=Microbacterium lacticum TaxID=33885 RepID=UPI001F56ACD3|nr:helix-turn-helix transcriptional regulator [Microbacterium lacticum]
MTRKVEWNLRRLLALHDIYKTTELVPLLTSRGVKLSREQVYRLVTSTPQRLNLEVLDALCDILDCTPNDLISFSAATGSVSETVDLGLA